MKSSTILRRQRHGAPSGPWPFVDLDDEVDQTRLDDPFSHLLPSAAACDHKKTPEQLYCWCKYPQSLYPNWTKRQQRKSSILRVIDGSRLESSTVYYLDVKTDGIFVSAGRREFNRNTLDTQWTGIQTGRAKDVRLRMLFVDHCSGPVLQMIGTRYNVEPFYFSSTIGWTPCRFQSNVVPNKSDHLTVVFTFVRSLQSDTISPPSLNSSYTESINTMHTTISKRPARPEFAIDTQAPLVLSSNNKLIRLDRLALHIVRDRTSSTIISLHPPSEQHATGAEQLYTRVHLTGKSVYWCNIFKDTSDPTFVFLSYFWYAVYAWDEALEHLYSHICHMESHALNTDKRETTQELHVIRARLQYFKDLLVTFRKSVEFVLKTPNPAMQAPAGVNEGEPGEGIADQADFEKRKKLGDEIMQRECKTLLLEVERLERTREMMELRLKNVIALTFGRIEIEDNKQRRLMTEAAMKDNAAMKQLTYLTMIFLPAGFTANVYSMNIAEINPEGAGKLWQFLAIALSLTVVSTYVIVARQIEIKVPRAIVEDEVDAGLPDASHANIRKRPALQMDVLNMSPLERVFWPVVLIRTLRDIRKEKKEKALIGLS